MDHGERRDLRFEPDYPQRLEEINREVAQILGCKVETENYSHNIPYCINRIRLLNIMLDMVRNKTMNLKWLEALYSKNNFDLEHFLPSKLLMRYYAGTNKVKS